MHSLRLVFPELVDPQIAISMPNQVILSASERQPIIRLAGGRQRLVGSTPRGS